MSTVFKLKAVILFVCAFVVVSVSTAWGQKLEPVPSAGTSAVKFESGSDVNWVVRGDNASGTEVNKTIGIKYGDVYKQDYQYAFFSYNVANGSFGFLSPNVRIKDEGEQSFYMYIEGLTDTQFNPDNYGYDGRFKNVKNKTLNNVPLNIGLNSFSTYTITHKKSSNDGTVCNSCSGLDAVWITDTDNPAIQYQIYRRTVTAHYEINIYRLQYTDITSSKGKTTKDDKTSLSISGLTPGENYSLYKGDALIETKQGSASTTTFMLLDPNGHHFTANFNNVEL